MAKETGSVIANGTNKLVVSVQCYGKGTTGIS